MNDEIAIVVLWSLAALILWALPVALSYRDAARVRQGPLGALAGLVLGWVGWLAVKIVVSQRLRRESKDAAATEASLRHRMRLARGEILD